MSLVGHRFGVAEVWPLLLELESGGAGNGLVCAGAGWEAFLEEEIHGAIDWDTDGA
jgi:hypothetical protein